MTGATDDDPEPCSYAEFGEQFFRLAVTEERILGALGGLSGNAFDFGPMGVGPGRLAKVSASGMIGQAAISPLPGPELSFRLVIPVDVRMIVNLGIDEHRFHADVRVNLHITARAARPLLVVIDVRPPTRDDVEVSIEAESMRASLLRLVAGIDNELRKFVAKYVAREIDKPQLRAARQVDIASRMTRAWSSAPQGVEVGLTAKPGRSRPT